MPMILALIILLTMLLLTLMWSTIRKQENVIRELSTRESWLEREVERLRTDNEKLYRWLRYNGEKVIDEMTCELDALSAVRQTNRDSYRRQLYLFDCLSLMVWAGMEGATLHGKRSAIKPMPSVLFSGRKLTNESHIFFNLHRVLNVQWPRRRRPLL